MGFVRVHAVLLPYAGPPPTLPQGREKELQALEKTHAGVILRVQQAANAEAAAALNELSNAAAASASVVNPR